MPTVYNVRHRCTSFSHTKKTIHNATSFINYASLPRTFSRRKSHSATNSTQNSYASIYIYAFIRIYLSAQLFMCYIIAYFTSTLDKTFDFHNFLLDNLYFLSVIRLPQIILNIIPLIRSINSFGAWGEMLRPNLITHIYSYCI